jgi:hypothetical protein
MRALVLLLAVCPSLAVASPRRWAIGEIRVEGELAPEERAAVEERAWRALSLALPTDALLAPHESVARALAEAPSLRGCSEDRCSLALGDRLGVERLVTVRIERQGRDWTARLLAFAVDAAQVAGTLELPCAGCDVDALLLAFSRATAPLLRDERPRPLCALTVTAAGGATVGVDTVPLGAAPFAHSVAAGRHTVAVVDERGRPAAAKAQVEIDCPAGGARTVHLEEPRAARPSTTRGWRLGLGAAAALLAGGSVAGLGTAAAYHDRPACDAARCAYRYDASAGIAVAAVGVAGFGAVAAALLATARRRQTPRAGAGSPTDGATSLVIVPAPGGVAVAGSV